MISIKTIMNITNRTEQSIRAKGKKQGIAPRYKSFTKGHIEVQYTNDEAETIISSYAKKKQYDRLPE
jgi:hypothetical protein